MNKSRAFLLILNEARSRELYYSNLSIKDQKAIDDVISLAKLEGSIGREFIRRFKSDGSTLDLLRDILSSNKQARKVIDNIMIGT